MKKLLALGVFTVLFVHAVAASPVSRERRPLPPGPSDTAAAREALFSSSDLDGARRHAHAALRRSPRDRDALFIEMEAAALQADTAAELNAAMRLCESRTDDPRSEIAAARILDLAGNTSAFRPLLPRLRVLTAASSPQASYLRAALVAAAADGARGLSEIDLARQSGLITDWRIAGPFGRYANVDFDRTFAPERDSLRPAASGNAVVERFSFAEGNFRLPDYMTRSGVYYAAADVSVPRAGEWWLRAESDGTLAVFIDGAQVLVNDSRFRTSPEVMAEKLRLEAGSHRVLVKFLDSAQPLRIALFAAAPQPPAVELDSGPEADYTAAALRYWAGDYAGAIARLAGAKSAVSQFLLASAWAHVSTDSPEETTALRAALASAPSAAAAEEALAENAYRDDRLDDAFARVRKVAAARPDFAPSQELIFEIANRWGWHAEAAQALASRLRLHSDCAGLRQALRFYDDAMDVAHADKAAAQLKDCAPDSLDYAHALSEAGRHADAAAEARRIVAEYPLDREARALLVRELRLAGDDAGALRAALELHAIAPGSLRFTRMLGDTRAPGSTPLFDNSPPLTSSVVDNFYAPYRRDGVEMVRATAQRRFSGGPAVVLLWDKVVRLGTDGLISLYVHKITRVLDKDGIDEYGEVALPARAEVLELRTIKVDGTVVEPELSDSKATISMPGLAPGDAIEQEYVVNHSDHGGPDGHADDFRFTFGSFAAPILYSRFTAITPSADETSLHVLASAGAPNLQRSVSRGFVVRSWEGNDIAQSAEEPGMPKADLLPTVKVVSAYSGWRAVQDYFRNVAIDATRIGSRVQETSAAVSGASPEERARNLYRFVTNRIRPGGGTFPNGDLVSAEETLAARQGSRTAALLALARAAGLNAELLLARDDAARATTPSLQAYTTPLVRFRFGSSAIVVDSESENMAFGDLPPSLAIADALRVPIDSAAAYDPPLVAIATPPRSEDSVAHADVWIDSEGNLSATVEIRMVGWRGAQMRSILRGIDPGDRPHFFDQLALRIFPGALDVRASAEDERDPSRPLRLRFTCRAPHFLNLASGSADMDQLIPALGLRKMYLGTSPRNFPLYIDAPYFERATFRVHLAPEITVTHLAPDFETRTQFGSYSVTFRRVATDQIEIRRAFHIPVQVVPPSSFSAFSHFALRIDDAERQRLLLERTAPVAAAQNPR